MTRGALALAVLLVATVAVPSGAQTRTWVLGSLVESPSLVVPIATLDSRDDDGREWYIRLVGWTLQSELSRRTSEHKRRFVSLAVTPTNADYSSHIYRDGRLNSDAAYRAASIHLALGIERRRRNGITGRYAVIGDYRYVRDLDPDVEARWRRPYLGIEVAERWRRVTATESFGTRINGIDAGALARVLVGDRSWTQVELDAHAGRRLGRTSGQIDVGSFVGRDVDVVNAFLIGGSWHLADTRLVSGYRFGEFRLARAVTANARAGIRVAGTVEVGARASMVAGEDGRRSGAGVELRAVHSGAVIDVGVAWAGGPDSTHERRPVFYGQFTTAILKR